MIAKFLVTALLVGVASVASAETDRVEHFRGLPADSLEQAVTNFSEYNGKLRTVLDKDNLDAQDLATVHELTYTIENALAKINAELAGLAETLEEVHIASETGDIDTVKTKGQKFGSIAAEVVN
jgi:DnaJ-domain-containing protein 1